VVSLSALVDLVWPFDEELDILEQFRGLKVRRPRLGGQSDD
jgi:hypothetical protein